MAQPEEPTHPPREDAPKHSNPPTAPPPSNADTSNTPAANKEPQPSNKDSEPAQPAPPKAPTPREPPQDTKQNDTAKTDQTSSQNVAVAPKENAAAAPKEDAAKPQPEKAAAAQPENAAAAPKDNAAAVPPENQTSEKPTPAGDAAPAPAPAPAPAEPASSGQTGPQPNEDADTKEVLPDETEEDKKLTAEDVEEQILKIEESIREKSRILLEKRKSIEGAELRLNEVEKSAQAAEKALAQVQEELREVEHQRSVLLPQYERCQQNKDQHEKAEEYKREISASEKQLREADSRIKALEKELQEVSAAYKNERERKSLVATRVGTLIEELRAAVEQKIALTLPIDEAAGAPNAAECLKSISEITRERDQSILQWTRHARELAAIIELKKHRVAELALESERQLAKMRAAKDEEVRSLITCFQEERRSLQKDIEAITALNEQQRAELRQSKLVPDKSSTTPTAAEPSLTPKRRDQATPTEKVLLQRSQDLQKEKDELEVKMKKLSAQKTQMIRSTKNIRKQIQLEEAKYSTSLRSLENQILNQKNLATDLERENLKLEEACDVLAATLRSANQQLKVAQPD